LAERLAHVLDMDLAKMVEIEAAGGLGIGSDMERRQARAIFASKSQGVAGSAFGVGTEVGDEEDGGKLHLRKIARLAGGANGQYRAGGVAEDLFRGRTERRLRTGSDAVRGENDEVDGMALNQAIDGFPEMAGFEKRGAGR